MQLNTTILQNNEQQTCRPISTVENDHDEVKSDLKENFEPKKIKSLLLVDSFNRLGINKEQDLYLRKAERVQWCGSFLEFKGTQLNKANFCRERLCPMCTWRKSHRVFGEMSAVMDTIDKENNRFLFLTLTVKNIKRYELSDEIDKLFKGFKKLMQRKEIKGAVKGWFRGLEVTYNQDQDTYHPHFHIVLQVSKNYFGKSYIKQREFSEIWGECLGVDYNPVVHIEKITETEMINGVAEVTKYTVTPDEYLYKDNEALTDEIVSVLDVALKGRRLFAYGGEMKKLHKTVKVDLEKMRADVEGVITRYFWGLGIRHYVQLKSPR